MSFSTKQLHYLISFLTVRERSTLTNVQYFICKSVNLWIGDERSVSSIHKDHFENMYAVITGEKTFTLLPPTDLLYLEEKEYSSMQYRMKGTFDTAARSAIDCTSGIEPLTATLTDRRVKASDLVLTSSGCPTESLTWIGTDPDDPNVLTRHPSFRYAHPLRCKIQPGEILYIPGILPNVFEGI